MLHLVFQQIKNRIKTVENVKTLSILFYELNSYLFTNIFLIVGPPKEDIFLTTFYGLYFNQLAHIFYRLQILCGASEGSLHVLLINPQLSLQATTAVFVHK